MKKLTDHSYVLGPGDGLQYNYIAILKMKLIQQYKMVKGRVAPPIILPLGLKRSSVLIEQSVHFVLLKQAFTISIQLYVTM